MPSPDELARRSVGGVEEPVARWEIWTVATMLITTHGEGAEEKAEREIGTAIEEGHIGNLTVWRAIRMKLDEIRAERASKGNASP